MAMTMPQISFGRLWKMSRVIRRTSRGIWRMKVPNAILVPIGLIS
jgi:hypothetical protein